MPKFAGPTALPRWSTYWLFVLFSAPQLVTISSMRLVERDANLAVVAACAEQARAGAGAFLVVLGESGAGKTAFVEQFLTGQAGQSRTLSAVCDRSRRPGRSVRFAISPTRSGTTRVACSATPNMPSTSSTPCSRTWVPYQPSW